MSQLDEWLKLFSEEIETIISNKEVPSRVYELFRKGEKGQLAHLVKEGDNYNFITVYNKHLIEVYCDEKNVINDYLKAPDITDDILRSIFKYLAHHEYGHTLFCESTEHYHNFYNNRKESVFPDVNLNRVFWMNVFRPFKEFCADFKAKGNGAVVPKYYLNRVFEGTFENFFKINKDNFIDNPINRAQLIAYYLKLLYASIWFYVFDEWSYLLEKCGIMKDAKLLELLLKINIVFKRIIKLDLDLKGYKDQLKELTTLLEPYDYIALILNNKSNDIITFQLDNFLKSQSTQEKK
jgi:hypothetical protein